MPTQIRTVSDLTVIGPRPPGRTSRQPGRTLLLLTAEDTKLGTANERVSHYSVLGGR